jgi:hypothetical protein
VPKTKTHAERIAAAVGDSYFAQEMGKTLLAQPHLAGRWRTARGLYGAIARGDV